MSKYNVFIIKDTHSRPDGRNIARDILEGRRDTVPDFFFIEWSKDVDRGNIAGSFDGIAKGDAKPNLIDLATIAISRGIPVVPCDLAPESVLRKLDEASPRYAPHKESSLFQPYGMTPRDEHAAEVIGRKMKTIVGREVIGLLMFGSAHFDTMVEHEVSLKKRVHDQGIDVYFLHE